LIVTSSRGKRSLSLPTEPQLPATAPYVQSEECETPKHAVELFTHTLVHRHGNHHEQTLKVTNTGWTEPELQTELDLVAVAADGTFAAFCPVILAQRTTTSGRMRAGLAPCTRRGFRRMGLDEQCYCGNATLKAKDSITARLGVDSENPSGAGRLYESLGSQGVHPN
jgi:hypothetical protein